jgi:hypothetical protein
MGHSFVRSGGLFRPHGLRALRQVAYPAVGGPYRDYERAALLTKRGSSSHRYSQNGSWPAAGDAPSGARAVETEDASVSGPGTLLIDFRAAAVR